MYEPGCKLRGAAEVGGTPPPSPRPLSAQTPEMNHKGQASGSPKNHRGHGWRLEAAREAQEAAMQPSGGPPATSVRGGQLISQARKRAVHPRNRARFGETRGRASDAHDVG